MRIQIIRKDGKIHGLAIVRGQGKVLAAQQGSTYWRICEHCCENEANVFCKTHARFVCVRCLSFHGKQSVGGNFILGYACKLVSLAYYRALAKRIDDEMHNEPHNEPHGLYQVRSRRNWVEQYGQHPNVQKWLRENPPPADWEGPREAYAYAEMPILLLGVPPVLEEVETKSTNEKQGVI